jgi:hypothetical protein
MKVPHDGTSTVTYRTSRFEYDQVGNTTKVTTPRGAGGLLKATKEDLARAKARARVRHPAWFRDFARLEGETVEVNFYSTLTVPSAGPRPSGRTRRASTGRRTRTRSVISGCAVMASTVAVMCH